MKNVLVTGGAGFIGSNFIHYILGMIPELNVINYDALTYAGNLANLSELTNNLNYKFIQGNICDEKLFESVLEENRIDTVVHFAAESHVDRSIADPSPFVNTNTLGTCIILEAARKYWTSTNISCQTRFHHISTDEVFGSLNETDSAFSEQTPYSPNSPYAASKAASDHFVRAYHHTFGLPVTITNCSNNYGPYQYPEKLIPLIIFNALNGKSLPIYGDGKQIRDWLYVTDHCDAILKVLTHGQPGDTYCIGGNNQVTNLDMVHLVCSILDEIVPNSPYCPHSHLITFVTDRKGHDRRYAMNTTNIKSTLGWEPKHTIEAGLRKTIKWYLDHPEWVNQVSQKKQYQQWVNQQYSQKTEGGK